jgi:hypothetical protein
MPRVLVAYTTVSQGLLTVALDRAVSFLAGDIGSTDCGLTLDVAMTPTESLRVFMASSFPLLFRY